MPLRVASWGQSPIFPGSCAIGNIFAETILAERRQHNRNETPGAESRERSEPPRLDRYRQAASMPCRGLFRWPLDRFGEGKFQYDFAVVIGHFEDGTQHARLVALGFEQLPDRSSRNLPGMIGIAQFLTLGVENQLFSDPGVEVIFWHDANPYGLEGTRLEPGNVSQVLYWIGIGTWPDGPQSEASTRDGLRGLVRSH